MKERYERPVFAVENLMLNEAVAACSANRDSGCRVLLREEVVRNNPTGQLHDFNNVNSWWKFLLSLILGANFDHQMNYQWVDSDNDGRIEDKEVTKYFTCNHITNNSSAHAALEENCTCLLS